MLTSVGGKPWQSSACARSVADLCRGQPWQRGLSSLCRVHGARLHGAGGGLLRAGALRVHRKPGGGGERRPRGEVPGGRGPVRKGRCLFGRCQLRVIYFGDEVSTGHEESGFQGPPGVYSGFPGDLLCSRQRRSIVEFLFCLVSGWMKPENGNRVTWLLLIALCLPWLLNDAAEFAFFFPFFVQS